MSRDSIDPDQVRAVAAKVALTIDPSTVVGLVHFGSLFLHWNRAINLGGAITATSLVERHFLDAFAAQRFVGERDLVVDVGAGGGLPIIPMALLRPLARFEVFEPTAKKVAFLRTAARELGIADRLLISARRLEEPLPSSVVEKFDVATSRATLAPEQWLALGRRLVRPGGRVLVFVTRRDGGLEHGDREGLSYAPDRRLLVF